ncbi:RNA-binding transcriptional accessory protein [Panacibacter ginsenosidivorans]|uniref:RNA-binding transcriptional accessory protein n=1 Tax=Panacibacter ginsenosidivorans TaxID=1813871 RepID=A0A5B8V5E3_9BACT|nr:Tex family protein [Panacibacter ginsenosidivorans]QEC66023.1 RNA-binding transcriptional accessory protein [Panacibacter ginsenosidivorans]
MSEFAQPIALKLNIRTAQAEAVLSLFEEGATIPFIARYRKDKTGGLDEVQIQQVQDENKLLKEFTERKVFIEKTITEHDKMTDALQQKINAATTITELEDIYLPYKPKRKTKAQTARENGLEPLALLILEQKEVDLNIEASNYINEKITTTDESLQGARDIIAEMVNEDANVRAKLRKLFGDTATVQCKVLADKEAEGIKYKDYFDFSEPVSKIPSHRILAVLRGFLEGFLRISIAPVEEDALELLEKQYVKGMNASVDQIKKAIKDAYKRLLQPSLETEFRTALKQKADEEAINVFAENLRQLLLSSPLGSKKLLAIDPGYRTGCKIVCLDEKGELLHNDLIYIHEPNKLYDAEYKIRELVKKYDTQAFAIGDGTAGRETEQFIKKLNLGLPVFLVNEDGASVYSASETAREEFPDYDVTVRGSVSIGRRLMDPLAELVKIDPKSIGVGQYQHDVNQTRLKERLDQTVISCVNAVGVNLNTASKHLLSYVSGIGSTLADNIIKYRNENGKFTSRDQLQKVPRLGGKAFEQCAGFLRIKDGDNPLDASAVHPEAYKVVQAMAKEMNADVKSLIGNEALLKEINTKKYVSEEIGELTIKDILNELKKPGLDPRSELEQFEFADIYKIEDVNVGMVVPGVVTNITRFGAFVDIGVKQDGLVHVSEISHKYITDPNEVLKLNDKVQVKVLEVDAIRKRIALSIKQTQNMPAKNERPKFKAQNKKEPQVTEMNINDALSILKKKFGK